MDGLLQQLCNYELQPDTTLLTASQPGLIRKRGKLTNTRARSDRSNTHAERRQVVWSGHRPAELIRSGGDETAKTLAAHCQKTWGEKTWTTDWTQSLVIPLPIKDKLRQSQNYMIISRLILVTIVKCC
ncbi:hypothetical protein ElyMa_000369000 [Elysia marginata]|uniref:Uncharacterized protein n=1 Tax=Elysia marginata TaxID=1093978 RepID=A0AAV4FGS8_9GAST|nr:hypothetical protein ElyMa_000369000 [Elysia marginata]